MLINKKGDILKADENLICHQVNEDGVMSGGLALQVATQYPYVEKKYKEFCKTFQKEQLYGEYKVVSIGEKKYIANCFTQRHFHTSLTDIEKVFRGLLESCKLNGFSIAIPYKYGCGIATGNWDLVSNLLEKLSNEYGVDINVYEYNKQ